MKPFIAILKKFWYLADESTGQAPRFSKTFIQASLGNGIVFGMVETPSQSPSPCCRKPIWMS